MTFKKGYIPWNKGKEWAPVSAFKKGVYHGYGFKKGGVSPRKGVKLSEETKEKIRMSKIGTIVSEETKKRMSVSLGSGDKNKSWKGNEVGYRGLHLWIEKILGKAIHCSFDFSHVSNRYHWANISGAYLRNPEDFMSLCAKCHKQYDMIRSGRVYL